MKLIGASIILLGLQVAFCASVGVESEGFWKVSLYRYAVTYTLPLFLVGVGVEAWKFRWR